MAVSSIPLLTITENISGGTASTVAPNVLPRGDKVRAGSYTRVQAQDKEKRGANGKNR